ncbi:MAG: DMT family transporter [Candidatus Bathyarchaeota archaeon]|nr:DMT family transporter [Candidatus Bathyarchaeota archaeon]
MVSGLGNLRKMQGYVLIIIASTLWGTMGILAKLAFGHGIVPETLIALRLAVSFVTLAVGLGLFRKDAFKLQKADALMFLVLGVFAIAFQRISYFYAVNLTTATVAAILFYTYPVFVTLFAVFFLKEKFDRAMLMAVVMTFSGVALVVRIYDFASLNIDFVGMLFGLLSSLLFVLYFVMIKRLRDRYSNWTLSVYGDGIGVLALLPIIYFSASNIVEFSTELWLLILAIAWGPSLLAYLFYSYALKYVDASKGSILGVIEPLSAALFSASILGEKLEAPQVVGIALALAGVALLFRKRG